MTTDASEQISPSPEIDTPGIDIPIDGALVCEILSLCKTQPNDAALILRTATKDPGVFIGLTLWLMNRNDPAPHFDLYQRFLATSPDERVAALEPLKQQRCGLPDLLQASYDLQRVRSSVGASAAAIIAAKLVPKRQHEAFAFGYLLTIGETAWALNKPDSFGTLVAQTQTRKELITRASEEFGADLNALGLHYLRSHGLPEVALQELSTYLTPDDSDLLALSLSCATAALEAFDAGRWSDCEVSTGVGALPTLLLGKTSVAAYDEIFHELTQLLLWGVVSTPEAVTLNKVEAPPPPPGEALQSGVVVNDQHDSPVMIVTPDGLEIDSIEPPDRIGPNVSLAGSLIFYAQDIARKAATVEELLSQIMGFLVLEAPFTRAALLEISPSEGTAQPIFTRGKTESLSSSALVPVDEDSPLQRASPSVHTFNDHYRNCSPFGSNAFALAPIDAPQERPIALYADSGQDVVIPLDGRRVFRVVADLINGRIRQLPGNLPRDSKLPQ